MKNIIKGLLLIGSGLAFNAYGADGSADIELRLVHGTCNLSADNKSMSVALGNISRTELAPMGTVSKPVDFVIRAADCVPGMTVYYRFDGTSAGQMGAFALDDDSEAQGIGVRISDMYRVKGPGERYGAVSIPGKDGIVSMQFNAQYISLANNIIPGDANATVQLSIVYE
ncbi:TPA: type 1 fimbrial protein [Serratia marcescens]|nr:type 1 fimbrial protein [Serratia marcescens]